MSATAQSILPFTTGRASHEFFEQGHSKGKHSVFSTEDHPLLNQAFTDRSNLVAGRFKAGASSDESWQTAARLRSRRALFCGRP